MARKPRPSRMTMAGMIYDANQSLQWVMKDPQIKETFRKSNTKIITLRNSRPNRKGSSESLKAETTSSSEDENQRQQRYANSVASLFSDDEQRDLLGIGLFTILEGGCLLSGYHGRGIVMSRNIVTGSWSAPVAVGLSGVGAGFLVGASGRSLVYLIYDYFTLESIIQQSGLMFGIGAGATIGSWTKQMGCGTTYITSPKTLRSAGLGSNVAVSRGLNGLYGAALSIEAGICRSRDKVNARFYDQENLHGSQILLSGETIPIPDTTTKGTCNVEAKRLLEEVHWKLETLCSGDSTHGNNSNIFEMNGSSRVGTSETYSYSKDGPTTNALGLDTTMVAEVV